MPGQCDVSVIIPAYNAASTIDTCLEALEQQTVPGDAYEILVVDDGSSDGTPDRVRAHPDARLFTQERAGPAAARNLGARHARGDLLLFTDADCQPTRDWIEQMVAPFDDEATAAVKGAYLSRQREIVARFVQLEYEDKYARMARQLTIDFVDTYAAAYRRDLFVAQGGFDAAYPVASVEDQEFSFRLARRGLKMCFAPRARVYHLKHAGGLGAYCRRKFTIGYWKVLVTRRYPDKIWRDSHTPQVLKAQILLLGLATLALAGGLFWSPLLGASGILLLLFLLSTLPFAVKAWSKDRPVALISPGLLLARALALGAGYALGLVAHLGFGRLTGTRDDLHEATQAGGCLTPAETPNDEELADSILFPGKGNHGS